MSTPAARPHSETFAAQCRAEWEADPKLQDEFASSGLYTAFKKAEARGLMSVAERRPAFPPFPPSKHDPESAEFERESTAMWNSRIALQEEFATYGAFAAYRRAEAKRFRP